jgi:hypothetical protein
MGMRHKDKDSLAIADELAALPLFATVNRGGLDAMAADGRVVHLPSGWALISESTPADSCYVLLEGDAQVRHGAEVHKIRNATVITVGAVRAFRVGYEQLGALFPRHADLEPVFRTEWSKRAQV